MNNVYDEILDELREVAVSGIGRLHSHTREYHPISPPEEYTGEQIKQLRERNNFSQSYFGALLGVSLKTVEAWEAGTSKPTGTALRLFQILEQNPHILDQYILAQA